MSSAAWMRTASLSRRLMRLRTTALPTLLVTVKPTRGAPPSFRSSTSIRNSRPRRFSPRLAARNSARLRSLGGAGRAGLPSPGKLVRSRSGGEALAATAAACCDDIAAALGGHARAETMPALADEFGWLIGTLHLFNTAGCGPSCVCHFVTGAGFAGLSWTQCKMRRTDGRKRVRAYRKKALRSQSPHLVESSSSSRHEAVISPPTPLNSRLYPHSRLASRCFVPQLKGAIDRMESASISSPQAPNHQLDTNFWPSKLPAPG